MNIALLQTSQARQVIHSLHNARGRIHKPLPGDVRKYGVGYIPDRITTRVIQTDSRALFISSGAGSEGSLAEFRGALLDQGQSGSCVGHGTAMALDISHAAQGIPLPFFPSPRIFYGTTRVLELPNAAALLTDSGAMPSDAIVVADRWGIAPIGLGAQSPTPDGRNSDIWSADDVSGSVPENVNDKPTLLDLETAGLQIQVEPLRLDETSPDFGAQIKACIDAKIACGIGIVVDTTNFMRWDATTGPIRTINTGDPQAGGHWLALDYYYTLNGALVVGGPNSWSSSWPTCSRDCPSPFWSPGSYELTIDCLQHVCTDAIGFRVKP